MMADASSDDVFIVYKTDDDDDVAHKVCWILENRSLKVLAHWMPGAFPPGVPIFDSIVKCVQKSKITLLILSQKALEECWIILEAIMALQQSKKSNILTLRVLLYDVEERDIQHLRRGIFASIPLLKLDFSETSWIDTLINHVQAEVPLPSILPEVGSLAHGLAFSHYTGFLSFVLPVFRETIEQSQIYREEPLHVSRKYYMLVPGTFRIYDNLESEHNGIQIKKHDIMVFRRMHAGKDREFKLTIYKISKRTEVGEESFYFFADFPNILNAIYRLHTDQLATVDTALQLTRFYYIMTEVINHAQNTECFDTVRLIVYNEEETSMQEALFNAVSESVPQEAIDTVMQDLQNTAVSEQRSIAQLLVSPQETRSSQPQYDVSVTCLQGNADDCRVAYEIVEYMKDKNLKVATDKPNESALSQPDARWHIFVLSTDAVSRPNPLLLRCISQLHEGVYCNALNVLPVIRGIRADDIPWFIIWVTVVDVQEPTFCEKLLQTMKGGVVRMEHRLPSGDVATGLAWAYVINYLIITLLSRRTTEAGEGPDLTGRIQKFLRDKGVECGCIRKLFSILPKSCTIEYDLAAKANSGLPAGEHVLEKLGALDPVCQDTGGQLGRRFFLYVYKYTDPATKQSMCFLAEYCTPGTCLHRMAHEYAFAGLQKEDMIQQGKRFCDILADIVNREAVKTELGDISGLIEMIYYDDMDQATDGSEALRDAIHEHVISRQHNVTFT